MGADGFEPSTSALSGTLRNKHQECKNAYTARVYSIFWFCQAFSNIVFLMLVLQGFAGIPEK